jgi:glycerol-1-phosphate dehydrogenase [NAD(P)+]
MNLVYDPGDKNFWKTIRTLPGFPIKDDISLKEMVFEAGALLRLPQILTPLMGGRPSAALVVMDPTPMRRNGEDLKARLVEVLRSAGWEAQPFILQPDQSGQVHTDFPHIEAVKAAIQPGVLVLGVGSGVVTDITKHACHLYEQEGGAHVPFAVYQTANSVSAFTSNMAPIFVDGVKRTFPSRYPETLICDLETLCDAPNDMTAAGVGDMLAIYISFPDWYLAWVLGMDPSYTTLPQALLGPMDEILFYWAEDIRKRTPGGMEILAKIIALGGLCMSLSHATTPLSGYEHVMSHILDLIGEKKNAALAQHGTQVALTSIVAAQAYEFFLGEFDPRSVTLDKCYPSKADMERRVIDAFAEIDPSGQAGCECWAEYAQKLKHWQEHRPALRAFLAEWSNIAKEVLRLTRPAQRIKDLLQTIAAPITFRDMIPPANETEARFAFLNAPLMRKRLTIGDLFIFFDWDRDALWQRIRETSGVI